MLEENTPHSSSAPPSPEDPAPKKEETLNAVITIIFLFIMPLVGLILTWAIAPWSRKVKSIITAFFLVIPLIGILLMIIFSLGGARQAAVDASIVSQMVTIRGEAEVYYSINNSYSGFSCEHPDIFITCNNIKERANKEPVIHAGQDAYCAYIPLSSAEYHCIDSRGNNNRAFVYPGKAGYCEGKNFICP